jgi:hypothetical protein
MLYFQLLRPHRDIAGVRRGPEPVSNLGLRTGKLGSEGRQPAVVIGSGAHQLGHFISQPQTPPISFSNNSKARVLINLSFQFRTRRGPLCASEADMRGALGHVRLGPNADSYTAAKALFDH